jgi:hypothetical protein
MTQNFIRELTQLKQTGSIEAFIEEFQRIAVMVPDVSESRLMMLFFERLTEPFCGWVKAFKPTNLQDAIWKTGDLAGATQKNKFTPRGRESKFADKGKGRLDEATRRELRRKQLHYTCKEPWEPRHKCMEKGKIHYIEVLFDSEEEEDEVGHLQNMELGQADEEHTHEDGEEETVRKQPGVKKVIIASISGVQRFSTYRIRGVLQGQKVIVLIDGGASHNFIDFALVNKRHLPTAEFEGFLVEVAGGRIMPCNRYIPQMSLTLGRYSLTQDFYVMDLPDTNVILGAQWLNTLGPITTNYKTMEMSFNSEEGNKVTLKGMKENTPKVVSAKRMEVVFSHGGVAYAAKCLVVTQNTQEKRISYSHDIQGIIDKHEKVFGRIPPGKPPDRGFEHIIELEEGAKPVITTP